MEVAMLTVLFSFLVLAGFIGYFVIWGVTPALHTPLMAVTNAISGVVIVAAMLVAGFQMTDFSPQLNELLAQAGLAVNGQALGWSQFFGFLAVTLATVNIVGGFAVTRRMLQMFKTRKKTQEQ